MDEARSWRPVPVILATHEAEIRRTIIQSQPGEIVLETLYGKHSTQNRKGAVAQA
jgi:hypothetical protein